MRNRSLGVDLAAARVGEWYTSRVLALRPPILQAEHEADPVPPFVIAT